VDEPLSVDRISAQIAVVLLNRPDKLNALSGELMDRLEELWGELAQDPTLECVVLSGNGRGFCAGADAGFLSDERAPRGDGMRAELSFVPGFTLEIPVIVAVNGVCAGGGLHFVADGDIVIASTSASFVDPHVSVGQVSGIEPPSLALRLPLGVVSRMALLGSSERLSVERAYQLGLVTEVVSEESLIPRAIELAGMVVANSPAAVRHTRRATRRLVHDYLEPLMSAGWEDVQSHWGHPDVREGPVAFAEKRPARWARG
jgi:enoyl-CoA hydratase/carnithine racemase